MRLRDWLSGRDGAITIRWKGRNYLCKVSEADSVFGGLMVQKVWTNKIGLLVVNVGR